MTEQLSQASPDQLRNMLQTFAEALLRPMRTLSAAPATASAALTAATPATAADTGAGTPAPAASTRRSQAAGGSSFPDWLLERRRRPEPALISVVATFYLLGGSTRRMEQWVEQLGITRLSKSQVGEMARDLNAQVRRSAPGRWTPALTPSSPRTRWC